MAFKTIDALPAKGQRVLLRADLNVPVKDGRITDRTRIERLCPTIAELAQKGARVVVLSHFDRPKGKRVPEMTLRPLVEPLEKVLGKLVAIGVPLVLAAFWLFPRLATPLWGIPDLSTARPGLSDEMSPGDWIDLIVRKP